MCSMLLLLHLQFAHKCTLLSLVPLLKTGKLQERPQPCWGGYKLATLNPISLPATHTTVTSTYIQWVAVAFLHKSLEAATYVHTKQVNQHICMLIASSYLSPIHCSVLTSNTSVMKTNTVTHNFTSTYIHTYIGVHKVPNEINGTKVPQQLITH